MGLLADQGTINDLLIALGFIDEPIRLLYTQFAVYVGIVYTYLPFMILPLYANMEKLDWELLEAAADLGAKPATTFLTVTLPMTTPGIIAGSLLVFIPATGEYVIPDLLGGGNVLMIGRVLYNEFNANVDWPVASARGYRTTAGTGTTNDAIPARAGKGNGGIMNNAKKSRFLIVVTCFGLAFLYIPMIMLVIYSFTLFENCPSLGWVFNALVRAFYSRVNKSGLRCY